MSVQSKASRFLVSCAKEAVGGLMLVTMMAVPPALSADSGSMGSTDQKGSTDPKSPVTPLGAAAGDPVVARGRYVALAADCVGCHSAPGGKPFAGGNELKSPFGIIYGPNITPDRATGIGTWTRADFERALRRGIRKDGAYLYPAMPYDAYTQMSPKDMTALWAYMRSIPAVNNTPPKNTLPFPLTVRSGLAVWQSLYFKPGLFTPTPGKDAVWNHGAYLVNALGHCADCHTPRNVAQGLETQHQLGGSAISNWYAPDISNDSLSKIAAWNTDQIAHFLKSGQTPGNANAFGPMSEVVHDSLRYLTDADVHAMAVYLKDQNVPVQAETPEKARSAHNPNRPDARLAAGKQLFADNCATCHQPNGKGVSGTVPSLAGNDAVTASEPYNVVMAMLEGFPPQGHWGAMASFAQSLTDDQIADIANYVRTAWGNGATPNATPWMVEDWRKHMDTPNNESHELLCPSLPEDVMKPALAAGPAELKQAANDQGKMSSLVSSYRSARPGTSTSQVMQALGTAYCRAVATDHISEARMSAELANFAQQAAIALNNSNKPTT